MSEIYKRLKEVQRKRENSVKRKSGLQNFHAAQRDRELENLQTDADQLRQTITALVGDKEALGQETSELRGQLEESRSRLQVLSRELAAKDKWLENVQSRKQDEALKGLTKDSRDHLAKKLLEELTRARRFHLKVRCPHCQGEISRRFKVKLKQKERGADDREDF